ncbi:DUF2157 domain-containing protein [Shewanella sp. Scap07]|uniref:DUF2157 domain-containing protein n=1 Tax=Shewanella sp. Scap07 TaxID=2589987 RepID=UPI0015BED970|nr:DUF2157 domain-containing protein [Shewanella sp. Scap07]QLE83935.1 DUF2157 domain-containing protein [Shewanella sp. Scap07]
MISNRNQLLELLEQQAIEEQHIDQALLVSGVRPRPHNWLSFISQLLAWCGGLALLFAVVFFIAYNWQQMGKFAKFALVEVIIIVSILAYYRLAKRGKNAANHDEVQSSLSKISLLIAAVCFGVLLALFGQTYQTGADPWQLFFNWALLITLWVMLARLNALWMIWIGLLNIAMILYYINFSAVGLFFSAELNALWSLFAFNSLMLIVWERASQHYVWLAARWAPRILAVVCGVCITWLMVWLIVDSSYFYRRNTPLSYQDWLPIVVWPVWCALMYATYRRVKADLFMLAGTLLSVNVIVISFLTTHLLDNLHELGFLLLSMTTIGMATGSAVWLRRVNKEWQP